MADPASTEKSESGETVGRVRFQPLFLCQSRADIISQFQGDGFVRIQPKYPRLRRLDGRGIFLGDMPLPRLPKDHRAVPQRNFIRTIPDIFVKHDDDFAGPAGHAFQGTALFRRASAPAMMQTEMGSAFIGHNWNDAFNQVKHWSKTVQR